MYATKTRSRAFEVPARPEREGSALVVALLVISALVSLSVALIGTGSQRSREVVSQRSDRTAFCLAEAAAAEGVLALRQGGSGNVASRLRPAFFGDGLVWVEASDLGSGRTRLVANAMAGSGRAALEVITERKTMWTDIPGLSSRKFLQVKQGVFFDSYDSDEGSYEDQLAANGGTYVDSFVSLLSNEDVELGPDAEVWGHVHAGPDQDLVMKSGSSVSGSTDELNEPFELPLPEVPTLASSGSKVVAGSQVLGPGDFSFTDFEIEKNASLVVTGPARIVIEGDMEVGRADVVVDTTSGPVEFFVFGDLTTDTKGTIETIGAPRDLTLYLLGESSHADLHPHGAFHGAVYGPHATVDIGTDFEIFGAIAAADVSVNPHGRFHFDLALLEPESEEGPLEIVSWRRTEPTTLTSGANRRDPFKVLDVDPELLASPAESWDAHHGHD